MYLLRYFFVKFYVDLYKSVSQAIVGQNKLNLQYSYS